MSEKFKYDDVPMEVWDVWAVRISGISVGFSHYEQMKTIIKKYPKFFPWETKYDSIPKEVHDAYYAEITIPVPVEQESGLPVTVLQIAEGPANLIEFFKTLFKDEEKRKESQRRELKRRKSIWDKHYSKYKLEFRD